MFFFGELTFGSSSACSRQYSSYFFFNWFVKRTISNEKKKSVFMRCQNLNWCLFWGFQFVSEYFAAVFSYSIKNANNLSAYYWLNSPELAQLYCFVDSETSYDKLAFCQQSLFCVSLLMMNFHNSWTFLLSSVQIFYAWWFKNQNFHNQSIQRHLFVFFYLIPYKNISNLLLSASICRTKRLADTWIRRSTKHNGLSRNFRPKLNPF